MDRYLLPVLPGLWVALAKVGPKDSPSRRVLATALVAAFAAFSITVAADYFRWNEARWVAARNLNREGVPASMIYAGYEWFGEMVGDKDRHSADPKTYDYVVSFSGPVPGFPEVATVPWRSIWPPHDRKLHVLRNETPPPR